MKNMPAAAGSLQDQQCLGKDTFLIQVRCCVNGRNSIASRIAQNLNSATANGNSETLKKKLSNIDEMFSQEHDVVLQAYEFGGTQQKLNRKNFSNLRLADGDVQNHRISSFSNGDFFIYINK